MCSDREDGAISRQTVDVGVIGPHEVVTRGLMSLLADAEQGVTAHECSWTEAAEVDVVLFDVIGLHDPEGGDAAALSRLVQQTDTVVVAVDRPLRPDLAAEALHLGAAAYVGMDAGAEEVLGVIRDAVDGTYGTQPAGTQVARAASAEERLGVAVGLTPAEVVTLRLIGSGLSNKEIAEQLYVSPNTVKSRIRAAYRRLGVTSRSQAVAWAIRHGLGSYEAGSPH